MMDEAPVSTESAELATLRSVVDAMLRDLEKGEGDRDKRRQVEDWMRSLAEKYPEFPIDEGLREYYRAEAGRLRQEFDSTDDLAQKLNLGRSIESFLEKARDCERRIRER